jgi:hypothetical protein
MLRVHRIECPCPVGELVQVQISAEVHLEKHRPRQARMLQAGLVASAGEDSRGWGYHSEQAVCGTPGLRVGIGR